MNDNLILDHHNQCPTRSRNVYFFNGNVRVVPEYPLPGSYSAMANTFVFPNQMAPAYHQSMENIAPETPAPWSLQVYPPELTFENCWQDQWGADVVHPGALQDLANAPEFVNPSELEIEPGTTITTLPPHGPEVLMPTRGRSEFHSHNLNPPPAVGTVPLDSRSSRSRSSRRSTVSSCSTCHKVCTTHKKLEWHMRSHDDHYAFSCTVCDKHWVRQSELTHHNKAVHTPKDAKRFECEECGSRWEQQTYLQRHRKTHSDLRTFRCLVCLDHWTQRFDYLQKHYREKHVGVVIPAQDEVTFPDGPA